VRRGGRVPFVFSPSTEQIGVLRVFRNICGMVEDEREFGMRKGRCRLNELVEGV
jgi:hypothetical protein